MNTTLPSSKPVCLTHVIDVVDAVLAPLDRRLPAHVCREDLASVGKLALIEALLRFDGSSDEARAYCFVRVRGAIFDELRRQDPLSRHTRGRVTLVRRAVTVLERDLGRAPTTAEIADLTGLAPAAIAYVERVATAADTCSVDATYANGEALHRVVDHAAVCPAQSAEAIDAHASIRAALDRLPPNHAHVLRRYYLDDARLDDIAAELGVSKERVRQLREAAEKKLRADFVVLALWQSVLSAR